MSEYKLDLTAFKAQIVEKPKLNADQIKAWHKQMSITYDYPENEPPKMDRTYFWYGTNGRTK